YLASSAFFAFFAFVAARGFVATFFVSAGATRRTSLPSFALHVRQNRHTLSCLVRIGPSTPTHPFGHFHRTCLALAIIFSLGWFLQCSTLPGILSTYLTYRLRRGIVEL